MSSPNPKNGVSRRAMKASDPDNSTHGQAGKISSANVSNTKPETGKKNPKDMTKAERRELQERQRAAKAAAAAEGSSSTGTGAKASGKVKTSAKPPPSPGGPSASQFSSRRPGSQSDAHATSHSMSQRGGKDTKDVAHAGGLENANAQTRGLRIFSHFGLPKPPSSVKGNIHPAIVRLGLHFSAFKITGSNARCIATLTAFKTVNLIVCLVLSSD